VGGNSGNIGEDSLTICAVITTYNRASIVPRAIDSVLAQTRPVDELIVVDDGSADNTREVVCRYGPPVRYVYQQNRGLSAARNTGAREAKSEWVAFLDDDDEWFPGKNDRHIDALRAAPDAAMSYGGPLWVGRNGETRFLRPDPPDKLWPGIRLKSPISPCAVLVRRDEFLAVGGFNEALRCVEDWEFAVRFVRGRKVTAVEDEPLVKVYEDANSMSKGGEAMLAAELSILDLLLADLRGIPRFLWKRRILSRMFYRAAISDRERGRSALRYLLRSLLYWPAPAFAPSRYLTLAAEIRDRIRA
jgi:glycosyltransferase involved in cell wall biosynthesis